MNKSIQSIISYANKCAAENLCKQVGDCVALRCEQGYYRTAVNADFLKLTEGDIDKIPLESGDTIALILSSRLDINAVIYSHPQNICTVAKAKVTIPAVLDDMAQIVGVNAKTAKNTPDDIEKNLKKRNSVLIENDGCYNLGRTLNEAYTNCLVLEKSACVLIGASVLGGCHKINLLEAKLMNFVYKMKYSKKNQENLSKEEM